LQSYALKYIDNTIAETLPNWNIVIGDSDKFMSVSFVNGVWTRGGKHVDEILNQVVTFFVDHLESKKKIKVKPSFIKDIQFLLIGPIWVVYPKRRKTA
jgi:hypothetical protein